MSNQTHVQDWIPKPPKEKTNWLKKMKQEGVLEETLQTIKKACEELKEHYWEYVRQVKKSNPVMLKYKPACYRPNPEDYCKTNPGLAYKILSQHLPDFFLDECIEQGVIIRDDTFGYVFNDKKEVLND